MLKKNITNIFMQIVLFERLAVEHTIKEAIRDLEFRKLRETQEEIFRTFDFELIFQKFSLEMDVASGDNTLIPLRNSLDQTQKINQTGELVDYVIPSEFTTIIKNEKNIFKNKIYIEIKYISIKLSLGNIEKKNANPIEHFTAILEKFNSATKDVDSVLPFMRFNNTELVDIFRSYNMLQNYIDNTTGVWSALSIDTSFINKKHLLRIMGLSLTHGIKSSKPFLNNIHLLVINNIYMLSNLMFNRSGLFFSSTLLKTAKLIRKRLYKRKLKLKLFKRMKFARRLRRILRRKRFTFKLKFLQFGFLRLSKKYVSSIVSHLSQKVSLTNKLLQNHTVNFFYKLNSLSYRKLHRFTKISENHDLKVNLTKKFKMYLRNFQKKPYQKLRAARIVHWKLFFKKTLRQSRYKPFIKKYIKKHDLLKENFDLLFQYFTTCRLSWTKVSALSKVIRSFFYHKISLYVISLPLLNKKFIKWSYFKKKNFYNVKKVGKWSYLNFKRHIRPWLQKKKNQPKIIKHLYPKFILPKQLMQYDVFTSYLFTPKLLPSLSLPILEQCKDNFYIKLHMFRYNASKLWILH